MTDTASNPVDTAWRIHSAIIDWTGKVDSKASFALAIESAVMAGVIGLTGDDRQLSHLKTWWAQSTFWLGVVTLAAALVLVAWVVRPRLRKRHLPTEAKDNYIFFGHVRLWNEDDLEQALKDRDVLPVLTRQLINSSELCWQKHRLLQLSMMLAITGTGIIAVSAFLNR